MIELLYIPAILALYLRTWKYKVLIDDPVPRDGYMYVITTGKDKQDKEVYEKDRSPMYTITNIVVFMACCGYIHLMWGWKAALLFAVFPLNVSGVAWATGNYYMSTVLLCLSTHWAITTFGLGGAIYALPVWGYGALNSTLSSFAYLPIALFLPYGWVLAPCLGLFLMGKRFKTGMSKRKDVHDDIGTNTSFNWSNLLRCPKLIAYYISLTFFPFRLGFFHDWGFDIDFFRRRTYYISVLLCLLFWAFGCGIDKTMTFWWFISIALFSQYVVFGQFTAERYTYMSNVAWCVLLAKFITIPELYWMVFTFYCYRSFNYISVWRNNHVLFASSCTVFPNTPENFSNYGSYLMDYGDFQGAIKPLECAHKISKGNKYVVNANLMYCYAILAYHNPTLYHKALYYAQEAEKDCPESSKERMVESISKLKNKIVDFKKHQKVLKKVGII